MPELPEVETTRRGIAPHLIGQRVREVRVHQPRLRWPVPGELAERLRGARILEVERRAKYLLIRFAHGSLIVHLGMSGSLRLSAHEHPRGAHEHVELLLADGRALRLNDPRRFGAVLWTDGDPLAHPLLASLGPEPLSEAFNAEDFHRASRGRRCTIKGFIMDGRQLVGVGNIYASEALFHAGIHPLRAAGSLSRPRCAALVEAIKRVLQAAIEQGGTTLRDFTDGHGQPGYFAQALQVYGRAGESCPRCAGTIRNKTIAQRASYYCPRCQR